MHNHVILILQLKRNYGKQNVYIVYTLSSNSIGMGDILIFWYAITVK